MYYFWFQKSWLHSLMVPNRMVFVKNFRQVFLSFLPEYVIFFLYSIMDRLELSILHYHKIMVIYPYPLLVVIIQLLSWIIFINDCICILSGSTGFFFMIVHDIQKIEGNYNSPNYLNVMVNFHNHIENRLITR